MLNDNVSFKPSCIMRAKLGMEAWENRKTYGVGNGLASLLFEVRLPHYVSYKWSLDFYDPGSSHLVMRCRPEGRA